MSTRISEFGIVALLSMCLGVAACGDSQTDMEATGTPGTDTQASPVAGADQAAGAAAAERVPCALGGATAFARDCAVERAESDQGVILTMRHPDGGFRRLLVTTDGRGVIAADGAEPATVTLVGQDAIDVAIGGDHYRLPATTRKNAAP